MVDSVALADRRAAREAWKRHEEQAERAAACEELAQHTLRAAPRTATALATAPTRPGRYGAQGGTARGGGGLHVLGCVLYMYADHCVLCQIDTGVPRRVGPTPTPICVMCVVM